MFAQNRFDLSAYDNFKLITHFFAIALASHGCAGTTIRDGVLADARAISSVASTDGLYDYRITLTNYVDPLWYDAENSSHRRKVVMKRMALHKCVPEVIEESVIRKSSENMKEVGWRYDIKCKKSVSSDP